MWFQKVKERRKEQALKWRESYIYLQERRKQGNYGDL